MLLDIVAGLLGSQLMRAVAFDVATSLLCQIVQHTVTLAARPRRERDAGPPEASPDPAGDSAPVAAEMPTSQENGQISLQTLPPIEIVSAVAGRVRLRPPGLRGDAVRAAEITAIVEALDGVTSAQANPRTGTLLVHFDPDQTSVPAVVAALTSPPPPRPRAATDVPYLRLVVG